MGFLKQMKDLKHTVEAAPGMVAQAQQMGAQAQQYAAAQQAAAQAQMAQAQQTTAAQTAVATAGGDLDPIAGVSIDLYAEISKGLAAYGYDQSKAPDVAASHGVSAESWNAAMAGWNERIRANPAVAQRFNQLYTGR